MTYVMSDLHGRYDLYQKMLEKIAFGPEDELYILGDITDRNRGGVKIFKEIMDKPNIHMLLGNHDHMLREAMLAPNAICLNGWETNRALWYRNGGQITQLELEAEPKEVQAQILDYIRRLPLNIEVEAAGKRFLLCHASPVCLFKTYGGTYPNEKEFAVWHRLKPSMRISFPADALISGHTPTAYFYDRRPMEILIMQENVYDIDCGCASGEANGGRLGCLRLEDMTDLYVSN